jgi:hypothetical protein
VVGAYCGKDNSCWPGVKKLAEDCGMTETTLRKHIAALESAGVLTVTRRVREDGSATTNSYSLTDPKEQEETEGGGSRTQEGGGSRNQHPYKEESNETHLTRHPLTPKGEGADAPVLVGMVIPEPPKKPTLDEQFEKFWSLAPHRPDDVKQRARTKWTAYFKLPKSQRHEPEDLIRAVERYAPSVAGRDPTKICMTAKWIEEKQFEAFIGATAQQPAPVAPRRIVHPNPNGSELPKIRYPEGI